RRWHTRFSRDWSSDVCSSDLKCIVAMKDDVSRAIVGTAREIEATAICMGTRGAGKLRKLIGTNSSAMVNKSPLPLFVVPANYRKIGRASCRERRRHAGRS